MTKQELSDLADTLRTNTVKLRFFRGSTYDGFADEYLQQLTLFIDSVKSILAVHPTEKPVDKWTAFSPAELLTEEDHE